MYIKDYFYIKYLMMSETNRIEYKEKLTKDLDLEKEVVAFLNYREGGFIYIGVHKKGTAVGVQDVDGDMLKIKDRIKNNISPSAMGLFDVVAEVREGKTLIKIIVAGGSEKPYFKKKYGMTEKGCFIRVGTAAEPMPQAMIDQLFATRTRNSIGKIKSYRQDLNFEQLRIYYDEKGKPLNEQFKKNLELLTDEGVINYAGYLLADVNNVSIKVAKYKGIDRVILTENNEYGYCSLIKATKNVLDKIELENKTLATITSRERIEQRLWNPVALSEAIINAIIHNDYTREVPPKFEIFDDRIEITSAGALPEGLNKEDFFEGVSIPRNKELMRVYKDLELVEHLGSGVPRILKSYGKECFRFLNYFTRMTFPIAKEAIEHEGLAKGLAKGLVKGLVKDLTENQIKMLEMIEATPDITKKEMAEQVGISTTAIDNNINSLKEKGLLERIGGRKKGYWQIIKPE